MQNVYKPVYLEI